MARILIITMTVLLGSMALPAVATAPGANGEVFLTQDTDGNGGTPPALLAVSSDGSVRTVDGAAAGFNPTVSPDGRVLAMVDGGGAVVLQSVAGGPVQPIPSAQSFELGHVAWSPDGTQVAFVAGRDDNFAFTIVNTDGSGPRRLASRVDGLEEFVWSTDGFIYQSLGFGVGEGITRLDPVADTLTAIDTPGFSSDDKGIDASPDGTRLATSCNRSGSQEFGICIFDTTGATQQFISGAEGRDYNPLFSPDGTRIAFGNDRADFTARDLVSTALDGSDQQPLLDDATGVSWGRVPDSPPTPLEEPPPPPTNSPLECGGVDRDPTTTERADFADPVLYAVAVSQARFGCGDQPAAAHVVLSRDDAFADSLVGAALTGRGPLLYTQSDSLPAPTLAEIDRLLDDGGTVYLLGGTAAISQAVEDQLVVGFTVRRLAGPSRVETSVAVAAEVLGLGGDSTTLAVARAGGPADNPTAGWADSVSGGAWTAATSTPTVVTDTASLHPAVASFIGEQAFETTVLFGGSGALSDAVAGAVPNPMRVSGASRAGTAQAIAERLLGITSDSANRTVIAINGFRADGWLFGLPAAGLAADLGAAIALAQDPLPPETEAMACDPDNVELLLAGGRGALSDGTAEALDSLPAC